MSTQSREVLTLEDQNSGISFGKQGGCFISKTIALLIVGLFLTSTVATALLVYYYAPTELRSKSISPVSSSGFLFD